jgi:voltage-gated potassium channel
MNRAQRLLVGLWLVSGAIAFGTIGYMVAEDLGFLDSLYLTIITISTVGFAEPGEGFTRAGQILTIVLLVIGLGAVFYSATIGLEVVVEEVLGDGGRRRKDRRRFETMQDHYIVCGYGQVGREVWRKLPANRTVVIESDEASAEQARADGALVIMGDATHDDVLSEARITQAEGMIVCVRSDSDNVAIVLSARSLCPSLRIIARATEAESTRKLELAGADRIVAPQMVGAERLAALAQRPDLAEFVDIAAGEAMVEFLIEEAHVPVGSPIVGRSIQDSEIRNRSGVLVLAVKQRTGNVMVSPPANFGLTDGQTLVLIGTNEQLRQAIAYINS